MVRIHSGVPHSRRFNPPQSVVDSAPTASAKKHGLRLGRHVILAATFRLACQKAWSKLRHKLRFGVAFASLLSTTAQPSRDSRPEASIVFIRHRAMRSLPSGYG